MSQTENMVIALKDVTGSWRRKKVNKLCLDTGYMGSSSTELDIEGRWRFRLENEKFLTQGWF